MFSIFLINKRCKAITSKGRRCKAKRQNDSKYCHNHHKYIPRRFDFFKRYPYRISFATILTVLLFFIQFFYSPTKKDINSKHDETQNRLKNIEKGIKELKQEIQTLLELPDTNDSIIKDIDTYALTKLNDYNRMDSLVNVYSEDLKDNFPDGYALFSSDESRVILPLNAKPIFRDILIDWRKIETEITQNEFLIRMPDFIDKRSGTISEFSNNSIGGYRIKHRIYSGFEINGIKPRAMILEDYGSQVIFVISYAIANL